MSGLSGLAWRLTCSSALSVADLIDQRDRQTPNLHRPAVVSKLYMRWAKMGPMAEPASEPAPNFEDALDRLEQIVSRLEGGDMPLEEALEVFEEGVRLSRFCHDKLQHAERRVEILLRDADGEIQAKPFEEDMVQDQN